MKVLVTGAAGTIGAQAVDVLAARGYRVRALDLDTPAHRAAATRWGDRVEPLWGNVCDSALLRDALEGADHVIHLAAVIPPETDRDQLLGYRVNVGGTAVLLEACLAMRRPPRVTYASSAAVFGRNAEADPPRTADEVPHPEDSYARQKVEAEARVWESGLPAVVFRFGVTPPLSPSAITPFIFEMHPETRVELTHPRDMAVALANSLLTDALMGGTWMLGGGPRNRYHYLPWLNIAFERLGLPPLPAEAFGPHRFQTDWIDSEKSEALLCYQRRSYDDYLDDVEAALGPAKLAVKPVAPLVRAYALASSPYHAAAHDRRALLPELGRWTSFGQAGLRAFRAWVGR